MWVLRTGDQVQAWRPAPHAGVGGYPGSAPQCTSNARGQPTHRDQPRMGISPPRSTHGAHFRPSGHHPEMGEPPRSGPSRRMGRLSNTHRAAPRTSPPPLHRIGGVSGASGYPRTHQAATTAHRPGPLGLSPRIGQLPQTVPSRALPPHRPIPRAERVPTHRAIPRAEQAPAHRAIPHRGTWGTTRRTISARRASSRRWGPD